MNKRAIVSKIVDKLSGELDTCLRAAQFARAEATHEQNKAENKYDTRGLEASYLASGQSKQAHELALSIREFQALLAKPLPDSPVIGLGSLVQVDAAGECSWYFLGPRAGGKEILHDRKEILVITPQSPLGSKLCGNCVGSHVTLGEGRESRTARVLQVQ